MKNKAILLMIFALVSFSSLFAQQTTAKGVVVDAKTNEPLIGVTVLEKGTNNGSITNFNGEFTLSVSSGATLVISYMGYTTQEMKYAGSPIKVTLQDDTKQLDEVVVIGYGTATKRDLTGSIVKVGGADVASRPNSNAVSSLQGKVSGLSVVNSGKPGEEPDIRIRGTVSLNQSAPLYIIDGLFSETMNFVNPSDIESIEVLKDASSLAIFGVRGANGVIIVTTKKAKEGKTSVSVNTSLGVKAIAGTPQMTDREGFITLYNEQRANQGSSVYSKYDLYKGNTNWVDQIANNNALVNNNSISITNANDKNRFYLGIGYLYEEGSIKNEKYNKYTVSLTDELKLSKYVVVGANINSYKATLPQLHDFSAALNATPIVEPYNSTYGAYNKLPDDIGGPQIGNPLMFVEANKYTDLQDQYRFIGNGYLEATFLKDFKFRVNYFGDFGFNNDRKYNPKFQVYSAEENSVVNWNEKSSVEQYNITSLKFQQDYLLTYKKQFGDHGLTLLGGFTTYYENFTKVYGKVQQYAGNDALVIPNDQRWWYLNVYPYGDPDSKISDSEQWDRSTVSFLFRGLYNYKGKYNLNASFRRDGSSEISPSHRYQNFWALGGAWFVTEEGFMKNQNIFTNLKIKASLGQLGNQYNGVHYPYYPNYVEGNTAVFGNNLVPAYELAYKNNPKLKWETVDEYEGGLEADFLKNKLHFEANYYYKKTNNLLTYVQDAQGSSTSKYYLNSGSVRSAGVELAASYNQKFDNGLNITVGGNLTTVSSKVLNVWKEGYYYTSGNSWTEAGYPIAYFKGYVVEGVYQSYADKLASPINTLGDYGPGDLKFKDISGPNGIPDGKITPDDRTMIGNPTPDFTYGLFINANYKQFDFAADFQGVYGNEIFRGWGNGSSFAVFNYRTERLNRWNGAGTSNWEPQVNDNSAINKLPSTYMIEDGSYLRLRNIQLGYTFDDKSLSKVCINTLRIYLSGQNLFTWKHNSGFTPEAPGKAEGGALEFGVDGGGYPIPAITSLGLNITF